MIVTQAEMSVPAFVMKIFEPLITHSPSCSSARPRGARRRAAPGSVRPKAASFFPEARSGSHSRFCSSFPNRKIGIVPSDVCAATVIATDESIRVSSSIAIAYERVSLPPAAVLLGDRHAHQSQLGELADQVVGEAMLPVELLRLGRDLLLGEVPDRAPDELLLFAEVEVHALEPARELGDQAHPVAGAALLREVVVPRPR